MGGVSVLARLLFKVPLVALSATAAISVSASRIHVQDVADLPGALRDGPRWSAYIPGPPRTSEYTPTFRFADSGPVTGGLLASSDELLTTGAIPEIPFDATVERVNRAAKGDLLISRPPRVEIDRQLPTSGAVWQLKDVFSSYEDAELPKIAFAPAGRLRSDDIMLAHNSFIRRDGLTNNANIMMARAEPAPTLSTPFSPLSPMATPDGAGSVTLVAYAPASAGHDAPFDALLGTGSQALVPVLPPRGRPSKVDLARFMTGHGPQRRRPGDHEWAANVLSTSVFKESQQACLARGIYFEARGESVRGQAAVAQVILNRVKNPAYPATICGVVYQNKKWRNRCQFSFACDGVRDRIRSTKHYKTAQYVARETTAGNIWLPEVGDATHYHATYVHPRWARKLKKTDRIGSHIFYRTKNGGWS
ncbi:MAG TPA: cell wall hydrolase [Afifellaceae bacterium]|nr:cell wall hydrolase [Afifellaceae bacterium]